MAAVAVVAIALAAFAAGVVVGLLLRGRLLAALAEAIRSQEAREREQRLRAGMRPVERLKSGAITDLDPRSAAEQERQRREEERRAKVEAHATIQRERGLPRNHSHRRREMSGTAPPTSQPVRGLRRELSSHPDGIGDRIAGGRRKLVSRFRSGASSKPRSETAGHSVPGFVVRPQVGRIRPA